jgi:hypothetical protein
MELKKDTLLKKIIKYIFRSWNNEIGYVHPRMKLFPPIVYDIMAFLIIIAILINVFIWIYNIVKI